MNAKLKRAINTLPAMVNRVESSKEEFDAVLFDGSLVVVEKTFSGSLETNHVLFVIEGDEIAKVYIKEISAEGTVYFKEED
jgi:hypothetical protein